MGQNLLLEPGANWDHTIMTWFNEYERASGDIVSSYNFSRSTGHFTQMVWARNARVGCGASECPELGGRFMVCNYQPGGNVIGEPMYLEGEACSKCPEGTQCEHVETNLPRLCSVTG
ncbi:GLIPR1-like protein 1 [Haemaphysalis longicornis]